MARVQARDRPPIRVIVGGPPRSGTTLVQTWLMSSGVLASFPEADFFERVSTDDRFGLRARRNILLSISINRWLRSAQIGHALPTTDGRKLVRRFVRELDQYAVNNDFEGWIEKTPRNLRDLPRIADSVPGAKFVLVLRRSLPTISSLLRASGQWTRNQYEPDIAGLLAEHLHDVALVSQYRHRSDVFLVHYEDLLAAPEALRPKVLEFLGLRSTLQFKSTNELSALAAKVITPHETWKSANLRGWRTDTPPDEELKSLYRGAVDFLRRNE